MEKATTYYDWVDNAQQYVGMARKEVEDFAATRRERFEIEACATAKAELTAAYEALKRARNAVVSVLLEPMD
ncbi:MAG: hypothetical protein JO312_08945 [Hyphomicrobiales bacterium]|jgi:hypothetical protein|nr:hypothetical protein [Hyphomicrobiales bacterium]